MAGVGPAIGGLIHKAGRSLGNKIAGTQSGYMDVAKTAIQGKQAAEAQDRAHGHTRTILRDVHKRAGAGTKVDIEVDHTGSHRIGYSKIGIGEKLAGAHEKAAVKDFKNSRKGKSNPSRDAQGMRHDQPDHVGNAKALAQGHEQGHGYGDHPNVFRVDAQRVEPKALTASNNAVAESRKNSGQRAIGDGGAAGRKALGSSSKKKENSKMNNTDKWADTAAKRQGLPSLNTPVSELDARAKKGDYTPVSGAALARAKYYGLQDKK